MIRARPTHPHAQQRGYREDLLEGLRNIHSMPGIVQDGERVPVDGRSPFSSGVEMQRRKRRTYQYTGLFTMAHWKEIHSPECLRGCGYGIASISASICSHRGQCVLAHFAKDESSAVQRCTCGHALPILSDLPVQTSQDQPLVPFHQWYHSTAGYSVAENVMMLEPDLSWLLVTNT